MFAALHHYIDLAQNASNAIWILTLGGRAKLEAGIIQPSGSEGCQYKSLQRKRMEVFGDGLMILTKIV